MDIYILRDGEQIGPFSKDAAQILVRQGTVSASDLAWRPGTFQWLPLGEVLEAISAPPAAETAEMAAPSEISISGRMPLPPSAAPAAEAAAPAGPVLEPPAEGSAEPITTNTEPATTPSESAEETVAEPATTSGEPPADFSTEPVATSTEPGIDFGAEPVAPSTEPPAAVAIEPVTPSQIAFLGYFGIAIPAGLSKDAAETLIAQASDDPMNARRLASWEVDRFRLHPNLFNAEVEEKKEDRVQLFHDLCQTAGADHFTGVTKAHCQVLVTFLDVKYPRWDANRAEATERYFFPAIAEKFPQLVTRAWRGRLQDTDGSSVIARATRRLPMTKLPKKPVSPWVASVRGIILGLVILAVLYAVYLFVQARKGQPPGEEKAGMSPTRPFGEMVADG